MSEGKLENAGRGTLIIRLRFSLANDSAVFKVDTPDIAGAKDTFSEAWAKSQKYVTFQTTNGSVSIEVENIGIIEFVPAD